MNLTGESLLNDVNIDALKADKVSSALQSEILKPLGVAFSKNVARIQGMVSLPKIGSEAFARGLAMFVFWTEFSTTRPFKVAWQQLMQNKSEQKPLPLKEIFDEHLKSHAEEFSKGFPDSGDWLDQPIKAGAPLQFLEFMLGLNGVREWIEVQLLAATSATWTAFECVTSDAWVNAVNAAPCKFAVGVVAAQGEAPDGFSGKTIPVGLLAKHGFDLRHVMGTLLKPKFDFTTVRGAKTAFSAAFPRNASIESIFEDEDLKLLEVVRHVIVHRAGIMDAEFLSRAQGICAVEGEPLPLDCKVVSGIINAGINAACRVLEAVDRRLQEDSRPAG